ncbi:MAG: class I SAM-dependent methyltransferase [Pseudomonadota bacterium]
MSAEAAERDPHAPTEPERDDRLLAAARRGVALIREAADLPFSVRLWDGSLEPLGAQPRPGLALRIASPGVLPSLLRGPSLDRLIRHYAHGRIDLEGGTLIDFGQPFALDNKISKRLRAIPKWEMMKALAPFLTARADAPDASRDFGADAEGAGRAQGDNKRFIQFHYDVGNDFYQLFLDPEMQYSCAYFPTWEATLEDAQVAKLDMICRKLRLKPGERMLDIGCGWGGLLAHAAQRYGVKGHGVTLSEEQLAFAQAKMARLGLSEQVTLELRDYQSLSGQYDKIASIGMYEHIGLANISAYFKKARGLLAEDGLFLNHAISRGAKKKKTRFSKRPEQRALQKYIFPGGELDDIGHSVAAMERAGFEIHDVEGWREHYQKTTRIWCERLTERRAEAERLTDPQTYRIWVAYLGGVSLAFQRGSARIFQTLASKSPKGASPTPPSRADLYANP